MTLIKDLNIIKDLPPYKEDIESDFLVITQPPDHGRTVNVSLLDAILSIVKSLDAIQASLASIEAKIDKPSSEVQGTSVTASPDAFEELESALAEVVAEDKVKHPLEDYQISQKDVGSLLEFFDDLKFDYDGLARIGTLKGSLDPLDHEYTYLDNTDTPWQYARPYLGELKLHFIPHHAADPGVIPPELLAGNFDAIVSLWDDGTIFMMDEIDQDDEYLWSSYGEHSIVGYLPLNFVNPLKESDNG